MAFHPIGDHVLNVIEESRQTFTLCCGACGSTRATRVEDFNNRPSLRGEVAVAIEKAAARLRSAPKR